MKYTDLDEYLIFESRKTFEQLWVKEYGEEILYLDEKFLSALYGIPDAEQVKSQLLHNIEVIGDTEREKYISSLKQNYLRIFYTDLINRLRETEYNFRLSIDRTHDDDDLPKRPFDRFKDDTDFYDENSKDDKTISLLAYVLNRVVRALNNVKKLRLLAETIEETINDAEQSLPQHSLKVEAVEEKEQAEKAKNKLNFKYTKGNKITLYHVLRQLYDRGIIKNTWPEIAEFLIENVTGFENSNSKNLSGELSRRTDPMINRIIQLPDLTKLDE